MGNILIKIKRKHVSYHCFNSYQDFKITLHHLMRVSVAS